MLNRHPNAKITLNIQGCLLDMLQENGLTETLDLLRTLVGSGKIELVGSAKFHPILPLIPKAEIKTQIQMNEESIKRHIQPHFAKKGFFPPEMSVSPDLCNNIKECGYKWMIMDGIANTGNWPTDYIQKCSKGLLRVFRDTFLSNDIAFKKTTALDFVNRLATIYGNSYDHYIITAMDGETFGHHIKYYETSFLGKAFSLIEDRSDIEIVFISELIEHFPISEGTTINSSSWSTDRSDLESNVPFPLWKHPLNPVHKYQYRMLKSLYKIMDLLENQLNHNGTNKQFMEYYRTSRFFYNSALHSCWLWWASMRPHWSPNLVYKGLDLVVKTALNAQLALINLKVGKGNEYYENIIDYMEKIMNEMVNQELEGQRLVTF